MPWSLQDAKNRLSEVVREARESGPQIITVRGKETAVVLSVNDFRRATHQGGTLVDFLRGSPWAKIELNVERSRDLGRDIDL